MENKANTIIVINKEELKREEEIFSRLDGVNQAIDGPMYNDDVRSVYATILRVMKELRG